ncbi:MAG: response regulator, partial [FCB group bacterium]|nr:response regulator [FCB group bacterium]
LALDSQWKGLERMAKNPQLNTFLAGRKTTAQPIPDPQLQSFFESYFANSPDDESTERVSLGKAIIAVSVYDTEGNKLASTRPEDSIVFPEVVKGLEKQDEPSFVSVNYNEGTGRYEAVVATAVKPARETPPQGYLVVTFNTDELVKLLFGPSSFREEPAEEEETDQPTDDVFQVVFQGPSGLWVAYVDPESTTKKQKIRTVPLDSGVAKVLSGVSRRLALKDPAARGARQLEVDGYTSAADAPVDVFLAYQPIQDTGSFIVAYRPQNTVFGLLHVKAILWGLVFLAVLAVLCFQAYRNVHNNIVRPVMLLNEGAQIIGQGDLELKLKIGTGDEIEELATSFNKMALALKRNIRRLEESEERYRSLVTSMRDGIYQTDRLGAIGFVNPAGVEILGYTQYEEVLGEDLRKFFLSEADFVRFTDELEQKGFVERSRIWMKRRDGRAICVELSGNVARDDFGDADGIEGTFRDVTKNVRLEQEARERSERIGAINQIANVINSSLEAGRLYESLVVEVKKLVDFDYAALALLGEEGATFRTRQLWPEQADADRTPRLEGPDSCAGWVAKERRCLLVSDLTTEDLPCADEFAEGTRSCLCVPLYASGRIIGTLNLGARRRLAFGERDVEVLEQMAPHVAVAIRNAKLLENLQQSLQEVTRAREELHLANEELKTLDEMKTNLLSNVSHELRTPLVSVMGYTDMIFNGKVGPINDTQKDYLGISIRNIEKLVTLIENLLDFSRLHRGAEQLVFDTFDLVDCAYGSVQLIKPVADERNITVTLVAPDALVLVEGDKGKMGQIFTNLLSNAVKFNPDNGSVTVEIRPSEDTVEAIVTDTGIGIPAEALDRIFTRFYQYDSSSTRKYGGTGIGLSIAQDIARLHGSRITVSSEEGQGSRFRFTLPLSVARKPEDKQSAAESLLPPTTQLLVELVTQDRALSAEVRNCLVPEGMVLIQAVSAANAVALAQKHSPDCILIDMELNGSANGKSVLDALLADPTTGPVPLILLSNESDAYLEYRALVASRIKRQFRKSSLLSGIRYALNPSSAAVEPLGRRILCVDDDPEVLTFIARVLEAEGLQVDSCTSGTEALEKVASREYSLVLLDIAMPGIDGWEACRRIKTDPALQGIKVYMVTAKPLDTRSARTREAGADGHLMKPFKPEDLVELVKSINTASASQEA